MSFAHAIIVVLALCLAACANTGHGSQVCAERGFEDELVALLRAGIDTKEPNTAAIVTRGAPSLFDGSYDWHSCVAAHWALLVSARVRRDGALEAWLAVRLTAEALEGESELLGARDPFARGTWPYDEAWFCLMLAELERRGEPRVAELRRRHARSLCEALAVLPFPDATTFYRDPRRASPRDGGSVDPRERALGGPYCGFYRSWTFAWLALAWSGPLEPEVAAQHLRLFEERLEPELPAMAAHAAGSGYDFLWIPALAALAAEAVGRDVVLPAADLVPAEWDELPEAVTIPTVHVLGAHLSRAWPLAVSNTPAERAAYAEARDLLRARRELWASDFPACSHWVPQYLFVGEWLAAGRP